ncbi:SUMF1/EgtB/PvdO family nonheme iron enzyme [Ferruginibacter yonginensis]|uniref:SUMF1/EgtB/PvdO family nonheme iron enzyme n=1 Tax=Ferruginibacter yonginensis TaxID=1310416 RepID=A0ABV8QMR0_9BACT
MKKLLIIMFATLVSVATFANDVLVSAISLTGQTTTGALNTHYTNVQFNIGWKNSWRTSTNESNYDGCWIFIKYRKQSTSVWLHATLNATGQTAPAGSVLKPSNDSKGAWIYRATDGIGDVTYNTAQLRWNYGADGVLDNENVEVQVYAVEMVYCPTGAFNLGNASTETSKFRDGVVDTWFPITSEAAITCGISAGNLTASGSFLNSGSIPAAYPKGYNAFWVMKYEFSEQQYVDFLNTLDQTNATNKNNIGATGLVPNMVANSPEKAARGFSPLNLLAWLDWAAMRPMTEFEFEKACRGNNNTPSPLEYAWGNTTIAQVATPTAQNTATETWATGNASYSSSIVIRCGALATATSNRISSGATFYGAMEMSGNNAEPTVYAGNAQGRSYTGLHGDGVLTATAEANTPNWPSSTNNPCVLFRGGGNGNVTFQLQVSDRSAGINDYTTPATANGGRGVRTGE